MPGEVIDWCQKCGARVRAKMLQPVQTARATHSSPAEYEDWCPECRNPNPRQKGDDDGIEYADPRDAREDRL